MSLPMVSGAGDRARRRLGPDPAAGATSRDGHTEADTQRGPAPRPNMDPRLACRDPAPASTAGSWWMAGLVRERRDTVGLPETGLSFVGLLETALSFVGLLETGMARDSRSVRNRGRSVCKRRGWLVYESLRDTGRELEIALFSRDGFIQ